MENQLIPFISTFIGTRGAIALSILLLLFPILRHIWEIWQKNRLTRSDYVIKSYQDFMKDSQMLDIFYRIDYNKLEPINIGLASDDEKAMDRLLGHFNNIGRLFRKGILSMKDADFISYQTLRIYQNRSVQKYLKSFVGYAGHHRTFDDFIWFARQLEKKQIRLLKKQITEKPLTENATPSFA